MKIMKTMKRQIKRGFLAIREGHRLQRALRAESSRRLQPVVACRSHEDDESDVAVDEVEAARLERIRKWMVSTRLATERNKGHEGHEHHEGHNGVESPAAEERPEDFGLPRWSSPSSTQGLPRWSSPSSTQEMPLPIPMELSFGPDELQPMSMDDEHAFSVLSQG